MIRMVARMFAGVMVRYWQWRIRRAAKVISVLDDMLAKARYDRTRRRKFWQDFVAKSKVRAAACAKMAE